MKYYINPDYKTTETNVESELLKDSHYSALVFGSKKFFEILQASIELNEGEAIAGIGVDPSTINIFIKNAK